MRKTMISDDSFTAKRQFLQSLYLDTYSKTASFVYAHVFNKGDAEDLIQDIYKTAWEKIEKLMEHSAPEKWVHKTAENIIGRYIQKYKVRKAVYSDSVFMEDVADPGDIFQNIDYLEFCPKGVKEEAFLMFIDFTIKGMPIAEVAEKYERKEFACYKQIERTREKLKKYYSDF